MRPKITPNEIQAFKVPMKEISAVVHEIHQLTSADEKHIPDERTAAWAERVDAASNLLDPAFRTSDDIKKLLAHEGLTSLEVLYRAIPRLNKPDRTETFSIENVQQLTRNALWNALTAIEALEYWTGNPLKTEFSHPDEFVRQGEGFLKKIVSTQSEGAASLGIIIPELRAVTMHRGTVGNLLANMLSNAVQHGEATDVAILGYQGAHHTDLVVVDNGKGIEESVAERMFEFGFSGEEKSSGIGLAEADKRLKAMGGRLFVNGHGGLHGGAEFAIRLPEVPYTRRTKC